MVPLAFFAVYIAVNGVIMALMDTEYDENHRALRLIGAAVGGVAVWLLSRYLKPRNLETAIVESTGERVILAGRDDFFFLAPRWWALLFPLLCTVATFG